MSQRSGLHISVTAVHTLALFVLYFAVASKSYPYHHGHFHHGDSAAHFHMEDRSPEIELHATDDGVHVRTRPASLDVSSKIPQTRDHSSTYSHRNNGGNGGYNNGNGGRWNNNNGGYGDGNRDRNDRGGRDERNRGNDNWWQSGPNGRKNRDEEKSNEREKGDRRDPNLSGDNTLRLHPEEPIKYEGGVFDDFRDPFGSERGLGGYRRHGLRLGDHHHHHHHHHRHHHGHRRHHRHHPYHFHERPHFQFMHFDRDREEPPMNHPSTRFGFMQGPNTLGQNDGAVSPFEHQPIEGSRQQFASHFPVDLSATHPETVGTRPPERLFGNELPFNGLARQFYQNGPGALDLRPNLPSPFMPVAIPGFSQDARPVAESPPIFETGQGRQLGTNKNSVLQLKKRVSDTGPYGHVLPPGLPLPISAEATPNNMRLAPAWRPLGGMAAANAADFIPCGKRNCDDPDEQNDSNDSDGDDDGDSDADNDSADYDANEDDAGPDN